MDDDISGRADPAPVVHQVERRKSARLRLLISDLQEGVAENRSELRVQSLLIDRLRREIEELKLQRDAPGAAVSKP